MYVFLKAHVKPYKHLVNPKVSLEVSEYTKYYYHLQISALKI